MHAFAILALPVAVLAADFGIKAGGPQNPPTIPGTLFPTNSSTIATVPATTQSITGNLSITKTTPSATPTGQSVVLVTTSLGPNGPETLTSYVAATSTSGSTSPTQSVQAGTATKVGNGAVGALAFAVGMGAFFL